MVDSEEEKEYEMIKTQRLLEDKCEGKDAYRMKKAKLEEI